MRKIKRIAFFQIGLDFGPENLLRGIGNKILNNRAALDRFFNGEKSFTRYPAVGNGLLPVSLVFLGLADNYINAVILILIACAGP